MMLFSQLPAVKKTLFLWASQTDFGPFCFVRALLGTRRHIKVKLLKLLRFVPNLTGLNLIGNLF